MWLPLLLLTAFTAAARGEERSAAPVGPAVSVRTVDAERLVGRLQSFSLVGGLTIVVDGSRQTRHVPAQDLVSIEIVGRSRTVSDQYFEVGLSNGDRVRGRITSFADDQVFLATAWGGSMVVPLHVIATVRSPLARHARHRKAANALGTRDLMEDEVLLGNGDVVHGLVVAIDEAGVDVETGFGVVPLPWDRCVAARLAVPRAVASPGVTTLVRTVDGGQITTDEMNWSPDNAELGVRAAYHGQEIRLQATAVRRIDICGGRWRWLSTLKPAGYDHVPMQTVKWPYRLDRNVRGDAMRIGGQSFDTGIGVRSRSRLRYKLDGGYSRFVSHYGLDDASGAFGNVDVEIRVDGTRCHEASGVTPGRVYGPVDLDVRGAMYLDLIVDFGANGSIQDYFNWADAALVR